jgi:hypothetical protein
MSIKTFLIDKGYLIYPYLFSAWFDLIAWIMINKKK